MPACVPLPRPASVIFLLPALSYAPTGYNPPMSFALLHADEETEPGVYGAYLRAQADADLLDILQHLDPERYPARCDAAWRELRRRGLLQAPAYNPTEAAMRYLALGALALAAVLLVLTALLTPADAAGPSWPTGEMLPDGIHLSLVTHLFGVAILRGIVFWSARFAVFTLLIAPLGGWLLGQVFTRRQRRARTDVRWLAAFGLAILVVAVTLAALPGSAVPALFDPSAGEASGWQRALPLWDPFASY